MDCYHITKRDKKWNFTKEGNNRPSKTADTKNEVIKEMREYRGDKTGSVKIHKEDCKFQEESTYQRKDDPHKSRG